jgi:hypothetical protein
VKQPPEFKEKLMGYVNMLAAPINEGDQKIVAWEYEQSLSGAGNGDSILIPDEVKQITLTLSFATGATGRVEATTSSIAKVKAGTAVWVAWDAGVVATTTQDALYPVTAIRAVQVATGTVKLEVRAQ